MKITSIFSPVNKPGLYRIGVDNKSVGYISASDVSELGIVVNTVIEKDIYEQLLSRAKYTEFYRDALSYADRRLRSKKELRHYLSNKGCDEQTRDKIIARLEELGIIDEQKLAEAMIHDVGLSRPRSKKALRLKLQQKQIPLAIIDKSLDEVDYDDHAALDELIKRKSHLSAYRNNQLKFFRYLLSQGFDYEDIVSRIGRPDTSGSNSRGGYRTLFK